jgi:DNA-binding CsgD family transcriptional regulator
VLEEEGEVRALRERYTSLSPREQAVMTLVVTGRLNKQVGFELGISEITVKAHRGRLMRKMEAHSLADLVNMAAKLRLAPASEALTPGRPRGIRGWETRHRQSECRAGRAAE